MLTTNIEHNRTDWQPKFYISSDISQFKLIFAVCNWIGSDFSSHWSLLAYVLQHVHLLIFVLKYFPIFFFILTVSQLAVGWLVPFSLNTLKNAPCLCCFTHQLTSVVFPNLRYDSKIHKLRQSKFNIYAQHCEKEKVKCEESKNTVENKSAGSLLAHSTTHYL